MIRVVALATVLASATPALAADRDEAQPIWGISFRTGPYKPGMGSNARYYNAYYASPTDQSLFKNHPLLTEVEIDYYILREFGLLGPMVEIGFWGVSGETRYCNHADASGNDVPGPCSTTEILTPGVSLPGGDSTKLSAYPITLGAIYKLDLIKRYTVIPLVPYAKGGLTWFTWRNTVGGKISHHNGDPAEGATLGARATVGLALNLDFLEPGTASRARLSTGIADSYLFGEMSFLWIDGFGDKKRLDFSGQTVQVGFAVDFL